MHWIVSHPSSNNCSPWSLGLTPNPKHSAPRGHVPSPQSLFPTTSQRALYVPGTWVVTTAWAEHLHLFQTRPPSSYPPTDNQLYLIQVPSYWSLNNPVFPTWHVVWISMTKCFQFCFIMKIWFSCFPTQSQSCL